MIGSTGGRYFALASSSRPAIWLGFFQWWKKSTLEPQFHLDEWEKVTRGEVQWVVSLGVAVVFVQANTAAQRTTREPDLCHAAWRRSCFANFLKVCARRFPSIASEIRNRIFRSPSVLVEQIPYAQFLQGLNSNWTLHRNFVPSSIAVIWSLSLRRLLLRLRVIWYPNNSPWIPVY
jgi:hypothetical protein